nr:MAG TPA: hypothetical protein [Caudoviricetes sp.]
MAIGSEMSPADIRACTEGNNGYGGGMGWGGDWSAWIIIFLIFGFFGWGGNGWGGGFGGGNGGVMDGYILTSDFANIERKIDAVNNGVCDGFYAMNTEMLNGFAGVNQNLNNGFQAAELARCNQQAALMQQLFQMQMAQQQCCCENRAAIQGVNYNLATQSCETRNTVQNTTRDIIDAMNCGFRSIDQRLTAQELAAKDQIIAQQNQKLFMADLAASQSNQNQDIKGYVQQQFAYYNPQARPAYIVPNPNCCGNGYGCGCGNVA